MAQQDFFGGKIVPVSLQHEMKKSYIDYAMSVIVGRALPDVRDGLKPVHRRILYAMYDMGMTPDKPHKKSARIVGEILGKYHPHGDSSVYDAMVRLAQDFSCRYPLVDGHGNFGSVDGDNPAAMRYTEARLAPIAMEMLTDIDKETVPFGPNYDESLEEPLVLPAKVPYLLLNGSNGIAVAMATNIPPHNLIELADGLIAMIDNPEIDVFGLLEHIKGPDFPTGGTILGTEGIVNAYSTGRGSIKIRAKAGIEELTPSKSAIIVHELPFQVNKATLVEKIADLVREGELTGISDLRDESDRDGMRIVIELKRDAVPQVVLNNLYKKTPMETSIGVIMLALVGLEPKVMDIRTILGHYLDHRVEIITKRTKFDKKKAEERVHILQGYIKALDNLDNVIALIRGSKSTEEARTGLMKKFDLSEIQAKAILEMQLRRLTALEKDNILKENNDLEAKIVEYTAILADKSKVMEIIKNELAEIKAKYPSPRKTNIEMDYGERREEDYIPNKPLAVFITKNGYIKSIDLNSFERQKRGGRGVGGMNLRDEDDIKQVFITSAHSTILYFTDQGSVYALKAYKIPEGSKQAKGIPLTNLLPVSQEVSITAIISVSEFVEDKYLIMLTKNGVIKRSSLDNFAKVRSNGIKAIELDEGDKLNWVRETSGKDSLIIGTRDGQSIHFSEEDNLRILGRTARGVRAITLKDDDIIVGMDIVTADNVNVLVVTTDGYGKRTNISEYRKQARAGSGILTISPKANRELAGIMIVSDDDEIILVTSQGTVIRQAVKEISITSRSTQGVRLQKLEKKDSVSSVAKVQFPKELEEVDEDAPPENKELL